MGKQRPVRRSTNREGLQEYLKSLETTAENPQQTDTLEATPPPETNQGDSFDTLFTDKKPVPPLQSDNGKRLPDSFQQRKPATSDTFDSFLKTPAVQESTKQPIGTIQKDLPLTPEQIKLQEYGNNLQAIRTEIETRMKDLDKTDKLQVDEVNELVKKFEETSNKLKKDFPIFTLHPDIIDNTFQNYPGYKVARTELSAYDPTKWTKFGIDEPLTGKKVTDQQSANNYQLLTRVLNGNISVNQAEKESSIWGTAGGRMAGSMIQGIVSIPDGFVAFGEMVSDELGKVGIPGTDKLKTQFQVQGQQLKQILDGVSPADQNFAEQISSGVGSMLAFMIPGSLAANFGKIAGLTPKVAQWLGIGTSTILESVTEAGNVYRESGDSNAATKTLLANLFLISITNRFGVQGDKQRSLLKSMLESMPLEGLQEGVQEIISDASQGKPMNLENILSSAAIGAIIGGGTAFSTEGETNDISSGADPNQQVPPISPVVSPTAGEVIPPVTSPNQDTFETLNVDPAQVNQETGFTNFQFEDQTNDEKITEPGIKTKPESIKEAAPIEEVKDKKEEVKQEPEKRVEKEGDKNGKEKAKVLKNKGEKTISPEVIPEPTDEEIISDLEDDQVDIEDEVNEAATSPKNDLPEPTEAQKEAGNYKKGHIKVAGFDISIENPKDSKRGGTSPEGKKWERTMQDHYGYFTRAVENQDGKLDVFVNPEIKKDPETAFIVDQVDPKTKDFDEMKVMLGYDNIEAAKEAYLRNYDKGWTGLGNISEVNSLEDLKDLVNEGDITKPFNYEKPVTVTSGKKQINTIEDFRNATTPEITNFLKNEISEKEFNKLVKDAAENPDNDLPVEGKTKTDMQSAAIESAIYAKAEDIIYKKNEKTKVPDFKNVVEDAGLIFNGIQKTNTKNGDYVTWTDPETKSTHLIPVKDFSKETLLIQQDKYKKEWETSNNKKGIIDEKNYDKLKPQVFELIKAGKTNSEILKELNLDVKDRTTIQNLLGMKDEFRKQKKQTVKKPELIKNESERVFNPKPTYESILDAVETTNDKSRTSKTRLNAKKDMAILARKLLQNGITAQVKSQAGKWAFYIDGVKQNRRSLGLVERSEAVDLEKIDYENYVSEPYEVLQIEVRDRQEIVAFNFVEASDLPSGSGPKVLEKGLQDIKENHGKETSPEAKAIRNAAEEILKNGATVTRMKGYQKQELNAKEVQSFVDEKIEELAIKQMNEDEASEEETASAEALISKAESIEQQIKEREAAGESGKTEQEQLNAVMDDIFGEAVKLGYPKKKKSIFGKQESFENLAKAKMSDKPITGKGKGEETTPLFQQPIVDKNQTNIFEKPTIKTIENSFFIRDTLIDKDVFNNLDSEKKNAILELKSEFDKLGYIDARTEIGPDQSSRMTETQREKLADKMTKAWEIEDKIKQLLKSDEVIEAENIAEKIKKLEGRKLQITRQISDLESVAKRKLESTRDNSTKTAYNMVKKELSEIEAELTKLTGEDEKQDDAADITDPGYGNSDDPFPEETIDDFGEKIGLARKDTANTGNQRGTGGKAASDEPAWMKDFHLGKKENGKYQPFKAKESFIVWRSREEVDTEKEAIAVIKLFNIAQRYRVYKDDRNENKYAIYRRVSPKKTSFMKGGFETSDAANLYLVQNADEYLDFKPKFPERPHIEDLQRTGKKFRTGNVSPEKFRNEFNFMGGEFGNWVPQDERKRLLNMAFDGLHDLADIINIPAKALSLGGNLNIAFGSRGVGLSGAQAHYEPQKAVFNLTRIKGAGSVAHEWFHAFDHYFGMVDRGRKLEKLSDEDIKKTTKGTGREYLSHGTLYVKSKIRKEVADSFKKLLDTIYKQPKIVKVSLDRFSKMVESSEKDLNYYIQYTRDYITKERTWGKKKAAATVPQLNKYDALIERIRKGDLGEDVEIITKKKWFGNIKTKEVFKTLNDLVSDVLGRSEFKADSGMVKRIFDDYMRLSSAKMQFEHYSKNETEERKTPTKFYYDAKDLDAMRVSDYFTTYHEMAARAFEAYIEDKINQSGNLSQYLVHSTENSIYKLLYNLNPYPEGEERVRINAAFDEFFNEVKYHYSLNEFLANKKSFNFDELAENTGIEKSELSNQLSDLTAKRLVIKNNQQYEITEEFQTLLSDMMANPKKYNVEFGQLYSNPIPVFLKGLGGIQRVVDDLWANTVGNKIYQGIGKGLLKITPEKIKELVITNYGLPAEYTVLKREALDAIQRYQELAKSIAANLKYSDVENKVKFTEAEQMRLSQLVKGGISNVPILRQRAEMAIREIKELEKLGRELETLPIETYNTKLSRARINELLLEKRGFEKQRQKIIDKFGDPETWDKDEKKAAKRATAKLDEKINQIDKKVKDSYLHGNEGYLKRVYLSKEQEKRLSKYGLTRPTRLDLTSAMHRKDIPFEIRKELGEILTAAYPAAKGIMLEGKDVSFGNFFKVISENPDWSSETAVIGWKQLPKDRKLGKLSKMFVEPRIFNDINDVLKFTDRDNLESFLKQLNANWKATKTIMNPSTHLRNIYSNSIMLDFSGVSQIDQIRLMPEAIKAVKGTGKYAAEFTASRLNNTTFNSQELGQYLDIVQETHGTGFMGMRGLDFGEKILKAYGKVSLVDTKVGEVLGKVYQMEEVLGKAVKFIAERESGKTINEARNEANKWLFDYSEVPKMIRQLRTNPVFGVPFVTWSYKAFPRIIEAAITRPLSFWKYPVIFSALMKYALSYLGLDDDDWEKIKADLPDRMLKGEWLLLPFKDENGKMQMLDLTYILPYKDVYDVIASGFTLASSGKFNNDDDIVDGLVGLFQAPILKSAAELIANKNTYTNTPIWLDVDTPSEKLVKASDYMYKTFMPSLAPEIPFVTEGGYSYHKMRSVISGRDDYYGRTFGFAPAVSSSFLGLKTSPIEMEKNVDRKLYELQDELNQLASKRNKMLRDESLTEETRLERSLEVDQAADQIREKIQNLNIPVKNPEINDTEKAIRKLQNILNDVPIEQKEKRKEFNKKINLLKIKLNNMMSDPDAYTGDYETKEDRINAKNRKSLTRDSNKSLSKSLSR